MLAYVNDKMFLFQTILIKLYSTWNSIRVLYFIFHSAYVRPSNRIFIIYSFSRFVFIESINTIKLLLYSRCGFMCERRAAQPQQQEQEKTEKKEKKAKPQRGPLSCFCIFHCFYYYDSSSSFALFFAISFH